MKAILLVTMLGFIAITTVIAQDTEYYDYLQKFVNQANQLKAIKGKYGDMPYKDFDKVYKDFGNLYDEFKDKYFMQTLTPNTPYYQIHSFKLAKTLEDDLYECSSRLWEDKLDKDMYQLDSSKPYSGLNKNKFWKDLDKYFADIEKLKSAIAEKK